MLNHLKTSFDSMRRAPFQALAAISVLFLTFLVTTLLMILVYSSQQVLKYLETRPQVIVFIKPDAAEEAILALKSQLEKDTRVKSLAYVTKEEALEIYKKATADNPLLGELVSPSTFPASLEFSPENIESTQNIIDDIKDEAVVDSVSYTANIGSESSLGDVINRIKKMSSYIRIGGAVTVSVLMFTSFLVLMVVIGMRITTRRTEIESLSLIGATPWFIRAPVVLEAIHYAVIGVVSGWLVGIVLLLYATPSIFGYFKDIPVIPKDGLEFFSLLAILLAIELFLGVLIALMGSIVSVSRSLRMIK